MLYDSEVYREKEKRLHVSSLRIWAVIHKLTMALGGWCLQGQRQEVCVVLSLDRWHSRLPIQDPVNTDWTSSLMGSHGAVQKMQTCHNPKAGILEGASPLEVEGT